MQQQATNTHPGDESTRQLIGLENGVSSRHQRRHRFVLLVVAIVALFLQLGSSVTLAHSDSEKGPFVYNMPKGDGTYHRTDDIAGAQAQAEQWTEEGKTAWFNTIYGEEGTAWRSTGPTYCDFLHGPGTHVFGCLKPAEYWAFGNWQDAGPEGNAEFSLSMFSGADPSCPDCDPDCIDGNPCNLATGSKVQTEIDYRSGDGLLNLSRTYSSNASGHVSRYGAGWTAPYDKKLDLGQESAGVIIVRRNGTGLFFYETSLNSGLWVADSGIRTTLTEETSTNYLLQFEDGRQERYSVTDGSLLRESNSNGFVASFTHNRGAGTITIRDRFGRIMVMTLGYPGIPDGGISKVTLPDGGEVTYQYDGVNLVQANYPDGTAKKYYYENTLLPNHLTGISFIDRNAVESRYANYGYDDQTEDSARAILTEHAGGHEKLTFDYVGSTQVTTTDAEGNQRVTVFEKNNIGSKRIKSITQLGDGKTTNKVYDDNDNNKLTCYQDEEGNITTYEYNTNLQRTSMTTGQTGTCEPLAPVATADTITTSHEYLTPKLGLKTFVRKPSVSGGSNVSETETRYDRPTFVRLPTSVIQRGYKPDGTVVSRTVSMRYNDSQRLLDRIDGPRTDVADITNLVYNECTTGGACGQLNHVTNAKGHVTTYDSYDANGRVQQLTDANGLVTTHSYDSRGRVETITQTPPVASGLAARLTRYTYKAFGAVETLTTADGITLTYGYDAAQYLRSVTDNSGNRIEYDYDLRGNQTDTRTKDPDGTLVRTVSRGYDLRNRIDSINQAGSLTGFTNDANGNLREITDPNNNADGTLDATTNTPDTLNRITQTIDLISGITAYDYDVHNRVTGITAPNNADTRYEYDDLGNLLKEVSPDRGTIIYAHDAAGNILSHTDARGITASYTYDELNRVTLIDYPGTTEDVTYVYDTAAGCGYGIGRLCTVTDESGTTAYTYDPFGNITTETRTQGGIPYTTTYTYDAGNRVTSMKVHETDAVNYARDAIGRLYSVNLTAADSSTTPIVSSRFYRGDGLLAGQVFANGLIEYRMYDLQGRLYTHSLGSLDVINYGFDDNGNILTQNQSFGLNTFTYDPLNRLDSEATPLISQSLDYDANGNRLSDANAAYTYEPATNRLATSGGTTPVIDAAGNLTNDGTYQYDYNAAGRLATVNTLNRKGNPVWLASYRYNARGQRTEKTTNTGTTVYHYNLAGQLILETDASGQPTRGYAWAEHQPIAALDYVETKLGKGKNAVTVTTTVPRFMHTDHLNTPRHITDASQKLIWRWQGDAFGTTPENEGLKGKGLVSMNLRFPGQYYDEETGLHYNWHRYYDPKVGRYITSDPIGLQGGLNTFGYVGGNPLLFSDWEGLAVAAVSAGTARLTGTALAGGALLCKFYPQECLDTAQNIINSLSNDSTTLDDAEAQTCEKDDDSDDDDRGCEAIRQSILATCASLTGTERMKCIFSAEDAYNQCMNER